MVHGLACYGLEKTPAPQVFDFARRLFAAWGAETLIAAWERPHHEDDEPGEFTTVETDLADLAARIDGGEAASFQLMSEIAFHDPALCYVGFARPPHAPLARLCVIWPAGDEARDAALLTLANAALPALGARYAYGFTAEDAFDALDYSLGSCMTALSDAESALNGHRALAAPQLGAPFFDGRLRMVYPANWLNPAQLAQPLAGAPLQAWIAADPARGTLTPLEAGLCLWQVPAERVEAINQELGAAGLLVAWRD